VEPFTLYCTTCRARLKVKDESVVGSILNCPRCGSMVHVVPPVDWNSSDRSVIAGAAESSTSATESSITLSLPPSSAAAAASAPLPPAPPTLPKAAASDSPAAVAPPGVAATDAPIAADAVASPSYASWLPIAVTWLRGDGLVWAGGLSAGVVVGAVTWFVMTSFASNPPVATEASKPLQIAQADARPALENSAPAPAAESAAGTLGPVPVAGSPPPIPAAAEKQAEKLTAPAAVESPHVAEAPPSEKPLEAASSTSDAPAPAEPNAPIAERAPSLKLDPAATPTDTLTPDDAVVDTPIGPASAAEPSAADAADPSADVDQPTGRPAEDDGGAMTQEDVDSALAVRLSEVKFVAAPLAQFVEFIADTSALAISVDDVALAKVGKKRTMPLSVHLSDTTAREALEAAIAPLGLVCELRGNRLFVTVPADATGAAK
jgi:hypothetical protein